jgi:DNA-binding NtrC family response regulator
VEQKTLREIEKEAIMKRFQECNSNRTRTAKSLGIGIRTLQRKLETWKIPKGIRGRKSDD